ncbi:substrate-binding domain-containing protein [Microvirga roseola]|uniref:substrate-binding domain-containing protein n=1 Tax=Microvirga roseola TaxID=2883126 RepID=UPI001E38680E|nr:substrate-binding domain-containing protein [Microvirga roseola]
MIPVTIHHVAQKARCSVASVSRVVNGTGPASPAMRARVEVAVAELGFQPSEVGRSLARRSRRILGVLVPSVTNPIFAASLAGIQDRARAAGLSVLIAQSDYDPGREREAVEALLAERPAGLVLTVCDPYDSLALDLVERQGIPTVLVYNDPGDRRISAVTVDSRGASRALVEQMIALGHRRIVFVAGHFAASDRSRLRYLGYADAVSAAGLPVEPPTEVDFIVGADDVDLTELVSRLRPTAIVASNDLLALSVIASLRRLGLDVPGQVSVAGFDGIALGRLVDPPLTTVEQPAGTMGVAAVSLLLELAAGRCESQRLLINHTFRPGGTLQPPVAQVRLSKRRQSSQNLVHQESSR